MSQTQNKYPRLTPLTIACLMATTASVATHANTDIPNTNPLDNNASSKFFGSWFGGGNNGGGNTGGARPIYSGSGSWSDSREPIRLPDGGTLVPVPGGGFSYVPPGVDIGGNTGGGNNNVTPPNNGGGNNVRPPNNGGGNNVTPPNNGGGNNVTPPNNGGGNNVRPPNNGGGNNVTPPNNGGGNNNVTPPNNGGGNNITPPNNGGGNNVTPPNNGGGNNVTPPNNGGGNNITPPNNGGGNNLTVAPYVAPVNARDVVAPNYNRQVNQNLVAIQPRGSSGTRTGYSVMDTSNQNANLTEKLYGATEDGYADRLRSLKTMIDTRNEKVGVIDTGINRNNRDMIGANVHNTQIRCGVKGSDNCYLPENDSGLVEVATTAASHDHGTQMAAVIAGNNGMTNAKLYASDSVDRGSNGGNQFLMMRKLNQDHGVKIFNNSWGSDNSDRWYRDAQNAGYNAETGTVQRNRYNTTNAHITLPVIHDLILNRDALIIKATGNEGQNDAHDENLAPLLNSKFKRGFITVSSPREDFDEANYCGRSAEWCVTATSSTQNYSNSGNLDSYKGTSPATARVSGTAALVKAAYPWMKNENISQTIFSTAKDFNDIAVQSPTYRGLVKVSRLPAGHRGAYYTDNQGNYYIRGEKPWENREIIKNHNGKNLTWQGGWGLLDPEAAAKGYGGFYWDDVVLDTAGTPVSVFYNDLKGEKGFTKAGEGKLVFVGNNSYRGDSIITGGTLEVNGNNGNSHIKINGGELTGYGTVANVTQTNGWLNNEGNLRINGDYNANIARGTDAGLKAQFGNLVTVTGKAKLAGALNLTGEAKNGIISQSGSRSTVLRAEKGLEGGFEQHYSSNPLFEVTKVEYTPTTDSNGRTTGRTNTDVQVSAKRKSASYVVNSVRMTPSGSTVARNVDKALETLDKKQETTALSSQELGFARQVFGNFQNMSYTMADEIKPLTVNEVSVVEPVLSTVNTNRELYRLDPTVYANTAVNNLDNSASQANDFTKELSGIDNNKFWANASRQDYDYNLDHSTSTRRGDNYSIGTGTKLDSGVSVAGQIDVSNLDVTDSVYGLTNKTETKMVGVTLGVAKDIADRAYVSGWVKGAKTDTEIQRNGASKKGELDGEVYGAGLQVGGKIGVGSNVEIKPYSFINHQEYKNKGQFNDDTNIIENVKAKQTQVGVGVDANLNITPAWQVFGGVQFAHVADKDVKLDTKYTGTDTNLVFEDWNTGKNKVSATVGTNYNITPNTQIGVNYKYADGKHDEISQVGLSLTSKF